MRFPTPLFCVHSNAAVALLLIFGIDLLIYVLVDPWINAGFTLSPPSPFPSPAGRPLGPGPLCCHILLSRDEGVQFTLTDGGVQFTPTAIAGVYNSPHRQGCTIHPHILGVRGDLPLSGLLFNTSGV